MPIQFPDLKFSCQVRFSEKVRAVASASDLFPILPGDDSDTAQYLHSGKTDFLIALKAAFSGEEHESSRQCQGSRIHTCSEL